MDSSFRNLNCYTLMKENNPILVISTFLDYLVFLYWPSLLSGQFRWFLDLLEKSRNPRWPLFENHDVIPTSFEIISSL